jgi:hypothetical protein
VTRAINHTPGDGVNDGSRFEMRPYNTDLIYHLQAWGIRRVTDVDGLGYGDSVSIWRSIYSPGRTNRPPPPPDFTIDNYAARVERAYPLCLSANQLWLYWLYVVNKTYKQMADIYNVSPDDMRYTLTGSHEDIADHMEMECYEIKKKSRKSLIPVRRSGIIGLT